jgi:signal transduction histidine kinase
VEGFGLLGMRERIALVNGRVTVQSASGQGTVVRALIPARRRPPVDVPATRTG